VTPRFVTAAAIVAAVLFAHPLAAASLAGDFAPVPVPSDWQVSKSIATSGTMLWGTGTSGTDRRATIFRIDLPTGQAAAHRLGPDFGSDPIALAITAGADGEAWFVGAQLVSDPLPNTMGGAFLGEVAADGTVSMVALFDGAFDNNLFPSIAFDPVSGVVAWTQIVAAGVPSIGWRSAAGTITEADFGAPGTPTSIALGPDGNFYFADTWLEGIRIGQIAPGGTTATFLGQVTFTPVNSGNPGGVPPLIVAGTGGDLWFSVPVLGQICRITSAGSITPFPTLTAPAELLSLAFGQDGAIYFGDPPGEVDRLNPSSGQIDAFPLPPSYDAFALSLLVPGPISFSGDDAVFAAAFAGPGLLRLRGASSPCPEVWERTLPAIRLETGRAFFQELGVPPDKPGPSSGLPPGVSVKNYPGIFGIFGAAAAPGAYAASVTVIDPRQCPADRIQIEIDATTPPIRRIKAVREPAPAGVDRRP
jgi:streptogramin lyase